jgi:SAM-dependent methyltransferase
MISILIFREYIYKVIFYILLLLFIYYLYTKVKNAMHEESKNEKGEHFQNKLDYSIEYVLNEYNEKHDDIFDKEFVDLYDIAYHDFHDVNRDNKVILKHLPKKIIENKESKILVGGCGVGKVPKSWKDLGYKNVIGVDFSKHMLSKAESLYPNIEFIRGNLVDPKICTNGTFDLYIIDERTLFMNHNKDMEKIIQNANQWLFNDGLLVIPIYDKSKLQLASRYYSTTYIDHLGLVHGFTYLDHFSHDCWYVPDIDDSDDKLNDKEQQKDSDKDINTSTSTSDILTLYFDKFTMKDGKKRIKTTMYYFLPKSEVYDIILQNGFEKVHIEPVCTQIVGGYELAIFKKKKSIVSVKDIEKKKSVQSIQKDAMK